MAAEDVTYHIMGASAFGSGCVLQLQTYAAVPPANAAYNHAQPIARLPFTNT